MEEDEKTTLIVRASQLTQEEQFCIGAYIYAVSNQSINEEDARILAYKLSRTKKKLTTENEMSIRRLADRFFFLDKVKAYMRLQEMNAIKDTGNTKDQDAGTQDRIDAIGVSIEGEDMGDEEKANKLFRELEEMKACASIDQLIKINTAQSNIIHRNKDNFKEDMKVVRFYLPLRCYGCELYKIERRKL